MQVLAILAALAVAVAAQGPNLSCQGEATTDRTGVLNQLLKPLANVPESQIVQIMASKNDVAAYMDCIVEKGECSRLGKAIQTFVKDYSQGQACQICTDCEMRRITYVLDKLKCDHPAEATRLTDNLGFDIFAVYNVGKTC
ncbi:uncharacterized protein LOC122263879 [Penaeus japonicus]|uniref:uncharacterized protein LOC122263873 n=1 Tax=Penaeus japonicus TaxID=27405 RepID=UPI001C7101F5|nr:uncharacterized protein LOC122263873 [Penaeus japonicus]XP_042888451.1 uncharacterized protein LOC122263874 [Penaeus japonicus]XP_042888453.1 uncharacterized protein LOC122263875 [Penaeus japonicus]XP_042888456.1 uncharacterized protein LOC122263877 [Penaeus japonicus]XP_042888458.1 uncharacterized protein LOC122263879 [Penaeus japonicus]